MASMDGLVRRCAEDYNMISPGDRIAVGLSGGKDSVALLTCLAKLREYYPVPFELSALTVSMGFPGTDFTPLTEYCRSLGVEHRIIRTDLGELIFDVRKEKNPCSLCSKMRRGALCSAAAELGIGKIALGHNFDDVVETFVMSLVFEGRIACFEPVTYMDRSGVTQIRPLIYVGEGATRSLCEREGLPIVKNPCPMNGESRRQEVKELIKTLSVTYPDLKSRIFGAIQRYPLNNWGVTPHGRS